MVSKERLVNIMYSRKELAVKRKREGMNCAQAVACTYCDIAGMEESTMEAVTQSFGTGIGGTLEGTCGAITGACTVIGMANKEAGRVKAMQDAKYIMNCFKERNQTVVCKELKGIETGQMLRACEDCVRDAAEFLEAALNINEKL